MGGTPVAWEEPRQEEMSKVYTAAQFAECIHASLTPLSGGIRLPLQPPVPHWISTMPSAAVSPLRALVVSVSPIGDLLKHTPKSQSREAYEKVIETLRETDFNWLQEDG